MFRLLMMWIALAAACGIALCGCAKDRSPVRATGRPLWPNVVKPDAQMESHALYTDGVIHEMNGQIEEAMDSFAEAAVKVPDDEELALDVTRRFLQYKHPERALEVLTNAVARPHAGGELWARLGLVYAHLGKTDLALAANQKAVRKEPTQFGAQQSLYLGYLQNKQPAQARKVLDDAARVSGASAEFLLGIAELYSNFGVVTPAQRTNAARRAMELLTRAADLHPTNPVTRLRLADGLALGGQTARAIEEYSAVVSTLPEESALRTATRSKLSELYLRTGDHKRAAEQLEAILRDDPTNAQANFILGNIAFEDKRLEQAQDYLARTILLKPDFEQAYYDLASAQINLDKPSEAFATLEKARSRFRQGFLVEYLTGVAFAHRKDYAEAIKHYTAAEVVARATETNRLTYAFFFQFGVACERHGDFDAAVGHFQKCLELSPDFAEAQNYLGYMWAERGTNLDRARDLIEKAVKAQPDNEAYLDSLAWVLFKLGKPREALDYLQRALKAAEKPDPTLYDHFGDIQAALGATQEAREAWRKSLELEPNDTIRKKLESAAPK